MAAHCLLYYITDRCGFGGGEAARRQHLLHKICEAVRAGVDYIQLREKDLSSRELESLAREAIDVIGNTPRPAAGTGTRLLINSRTDVATAAGADGVHLRSDDVSPMDVRATWQGVTRVVIGASCHSAAEVAQAAKNGVDFAALAPVFEKHGTGVRPLGLAMLHEACSFQIPVIALGGVNLENAQSCLEAGAAGIAAIRLFQENDIAEVVQRLRG